MKKTILFYQHFGDESVFRGAHYKILDYYNHIKEFSNFDPMIAFDVETAWGPKIPWFDMFNRMPTLSDVDSSPDVLFLNSGKDWLRYQANCNVSEDTSIVSPVNHFRALDPEHRAFSLLGNRAIRLCPSPQLFKAVVDHPMTNGKTFYLPNAVNKVFSENTTWGEKSTHVLIVGSKNPQMAHDIKKQLGDLNAKIKVVESWVSKVDFQKELMNSQITIHLPKEVEAHYIPAIESMMYESLVVMPNCIGNQSYAKHLETCVIAEYSLKGLVDATKLAINLNQIERKAILKQALLETSVFSFVNERRGLFKILSDL